MIVMHLPKLGKWSFAYFQNFEIKLERGRQQPQDTNWRFFAFPCRMERSWDMRLMLWQFSTFYLFKILLFLMYQVQLGFFVLSLLVISSIILFFWIRLMIKAMILSNFVIDYVRWNLNFKDPKLSKTKNKRVVEFM